MPNYISNKTIEKLKYDLVRNNLISFENLTKAEKFSKISNKNLGQTLIEKQLIPEEVLLKFIQDNLNIPYVNLENYSLDEKSLFFISAEDAEKHKILPLFKIENVLTVAMADPLDLFTLNNLTKCIKCEIEPIICSERLILQAINKYYFHKKFSEELSVLKKETIIDWQKELNEDSPDILQAERIIKSIVSQALSEEIFEIIFENIERGLIIKFKKPGTMQDKGVIPLLLAPLCVSCLKNISNLDSSVFDLPQLGKFKYSADSITGVLSTFPTAKGERVTVKLYRPPKTVKKLLINDDDKDIILKSLEKPGIILIAGSELSGKSFLAYTILSSLDSYNKNIMTIESIVKYDLKGINQCELNEKTGFIIEKALKFIDFQSPDIVYIEEITSGRLTEYLLNFVKTGKLVIAEINASNTDDLFKMFNSSEAEELKRFLNCLIFIKDMNNITIIE